jgi:hypothetical protein
MEIKVLRDGGKFPRLVMPLHFPIESDAALPFVVRAVELADLEKTSVHIQGPNQITIHIIRPEDVS